jgi:hypothetical protein
MKVVHGRRNRNEYHAERWNIRVNPSTDSIKHNNGEVWGESVTTVC